MEDGAEDGKEQRKGWGAMVALGSRDFHPMPPSLKKFPPASPRRIGLRREVQVQAGLGRLLEGEKR